MEFKITEKQLPAITFNFDDVKNTLSQKLSDYEKLVVTEETLKFCKSEQKHLAGLRKQVDTYRKDVKKELSKPITEFEDKCKEIISLILNTEDRLKEGIIYYDDLKRKEKENFAKSEIERLKKELELPEELHWRVEVRKEYCNLTAKEKDVTADITTQILIIKEGNFKYLKAKQEIIDYINLRNEEVKQKVDPSRYINLIESEGIECKEQIKNDFDNIIEYEKELEEKIKIEVASVVEIENKKEHEKEVEEEPKQEPKQEHEIKPDAEPIKAGKKILKYNMVIEGTIDQLKDLKKFLESNNIKYEAELG